MLIIQGWWLAPVMNSILSMNVSLRAFPYFDFALDKSQQEGDYGEFFFMRFVHVRTLFIKSRGFVINK